MITKSSMRRDWRVARTKLEREGCCRVCKVGPWNVLEAAHVIGRRADPVMLGPYGGEYRLVHPDSIVPLCKTHHTEYDARRLDLLPYLHLHEQIRAVEDAGGLLSALKRISGENSC